MKFEIKFATISQAIDARSIFFGFFGKANHSFWLDSSLNDDDYARFSFMGDDRGPYAQHLRHKIRQSPGSSDHRDGQLTLFERLGAELDSHSLSDDGQLPFDFRGGFVGYLGYELMAETEDVGGYPSPLPDSHFIFSDRFVAIDHRDKLVYVVALAGEGDDGAAQQWVDKTAASIAELHQFPEPAVPMLAAADEIEPYLLFDRQAYLDKIEQCKAKIIDGESYEICLTNRVILPLVGPDGRALEQIYCALRKVNPAPYSCWIRSPDYAVMCSSPERFLKISAAGEMEARPIKGTTRRFADPRADEEARALLKSAPAFFSENLMIVDLLRNDLARCAIPGSVSVPSLMEVESYATVHQLVSTIRGEAARGSAECLAACFPGGSMTGAPKRRTLEIINELEQTYRGIYSGAIGYLSLNKAVDLNIVIRTLVMTGQRCEIGVGGAITQLSDPVQEYDEMLLKALAPFSAVRDSLEKRGGKE
ncbi:hypothetical protein ELG72_37710 [Rhizobium leguminosarum]|uniref:anthranilate synthase component I family protein n=1 Tax=Rhizobium TaxID=379 RepID=UPI0010322F75|nr:chorismate-binding protein [Rhizobium leguminosarum]TBF87876.1 hypothetical protein ELG82_37390 [Rhizobium leguminosarum]TBG07143.1 hypothetical protein ELG80_37305 [Rhizobium leguminosarum]TBG07707.1 hypothetical protein ELG81_37610 [Rhizobium leguminosarum]TBG30827.1 hypothetical protein ELG75_37005 [Rhizobium leguminosarum]TBG50073.1 hypothetical protein ELG72_37710 [Rhizobium leguminosarum]